MSSCDTLTINFNSALSVVVIGGLASDMLQPPQVCPGEKKMRFPLQATASSA